MIKKGRPEIPYPVIDTYTFEGALCRCPTSPCTHRSLISLCERAGGARLHENAWNILICVDIAIPAGESEKEGPIEKRERKAESKWATLIENYEKAKKSERKKKKATIAKLDRVQAAGWG